MLLQVALMMVLLLLLMALAIDVAHFYGGRRSMQNAADAGALAGARALCFGQAASAITRASDYACVQNGAQSAAVTINGNRVHVVASETVDTYFAGIIGMNSVQIEAEATAACGETTRLCGMMPLAFDQATWDTIPCSGQFYVWDDDKVGDDLCTKCQCEDVIGSAASVSPGNRGWVRFSAPPAPYANPGGCGGNCGAAALRCWIEHGYSGPVNIGSCVPAKPGVNASALKAAEGRVGDNMYVLLWSPGPCTSGDVVGSCSGDLYPVSGFGYIRLDAIENKLTIPPRPGYKQKDCPKNAKAMLATKICSPPATNCGRTDGAPVGSGVGAVSLID
jgi:hypothetical protein